MDNDSKVLKIIIGYCDRIENSKERFGKIKDVFMNDYVYQHTCSFGIAQIGEQVKRLSKEIKEKTPEI